MKEIRDLAVKINKDNNTYTQMQLRLILYLYKNIVNTRKVVEYLNKKYGYELTELKLRDLAHRNKCSIGIDLTDEDAIKFLSKLTGCKYSTIIAKNKNELNKYRLVLYGRKYINELKRLGICEKKTYTLKKPLLSREEMSFINYILRGIIDGDGWIRKDGKEFFICSASLDFINWCKEILEYLGFKNIKVNYVRNDFNGIYIIRSAYRYNLEILKNKIYDKQFGMNRKYIRLHGKDVQRL